MAQDGTQDSNRVRREPAQMSENEGGWTEAAVEGLRGVLLFTPLGRMAELSVLLQSLRDLADQRHITEAASALGIGLDTPLNVHLSSVYAYARQHFVSGTILSPLDNIPTSGPARHAALRAIAEIERQNLGSFRRLLQGDLGAKQLYQDAVDEAVANAGTAEIRTTTPPTVTGVTGGQVRITGGCQPIRICFWPAAEFRRQPLRREYERQLELQERGINAMLPTQLVANRQAYCNSAIRPSIEATKQASQTATRVAYRAVVRRRMQHSASLLKGRAGVAARASITTRLRRHMNGLAALHNPDAIAGGSPTIPWSTTDAANALAGRPVTVMGHRRVNSSIGSSWGTCASATSRSSRLEAHAARQAANNCASTQATLTICQD